MPLYYSFLLLFTSFLWAGSFVVGKVLVAHASPIALTMLRWGISILCLGPLVLWREKNFFPPRQAVLPLVLMGATGVVLFNLLQFWALAQTTAMNVGVISTLNPLSIAIFATLFRYDRIGFPQVLAMMMSLAGVLIVICKGNLGELYSMHLNSGDLWMIAAVGIWGIYSVCAKWAMKQVSPLVSTLYSGIFGFLLLLPFAINDFYIDQIDLAFVGASLYMGVVSTVLCMLFWNMGIQKLGATAAGVFLNFNPVFTAIIAYVVLGEQMTGWQLIGSGIVIAGCYLFSRNACSN